MDSASNAPRFSLLLEVIDRIVGLRAGHRTEVASGNRRADCGEIIGSDGFPRQEQLRALVEILPPRLENFGRTVKSSSDDIAHCQVDLARRRLGGLQAIGRGTWQEWMLPL